MELQQNHGTAPDQQNHNGPTTDSNRNHSGPTDVAEALQSKPQNHRGLRDPDPTQTLNIHCSSPLPGRSVGLGRILRRCRFWISCFLYTLFLGLDSKHRTSRTSNSKPSVVGLRHDAEPEVQLTQRCTGALWGTRRPLLYRKGSRFQLHLRVKMEMDPTSRQKQNQISNRPDLWETSQINPRTMRNQVWTVTTRFKEGRKTGI